MNFILPIILGFIPSLIWLFFFLKEDIHPEPKKMIAKAFVFGGLSAFVALFLEKILNDPLNSINISIPRIIEDNLSVFLGFAVVEEVVKFAFVYFAVRKSSYFDEPIDAMIYMVTGALGFATAENLALVITQSDGGVLGLLILRFIGATLLHALSSAIIGHYWARGIKSGLKTRAVIIGLSLASLIHLFFNFLIFKFNDVLIYPITFLILIGLVVLYDFEELKKNRGTDKESPDPQ